MLETASRSSTPTASSNGDTKIIPNIWKHRYYNMKVVYEDESLEQHGICTQLHDHNIMEGPVDSDQDSVESATSSSTTAKKRRARSVRKSTMDWIRQFKKRDESHKVFMDKMKAGTNQTGAETVSAGSVDEGEDSRPVNILVLEGGGLRGHGQLGILRGLWEKNGYEDFLQHFDLMGGTSVGGIAAFVLSRANDMESALQDGEQILELARDRTFKKMNFINLLSRGALIRKKENSVASILEGLYGDTPLYNPQGVKAFALCSARNNKARRRSSLGLGRKKETFEPFVARTYDVECNKEDHHAHVAGSSSLKLWQAMAATSALPVLLDRVELSVDGENKRFADGGIFASNPMAVALLEAKRLWPNRPIGVVAALCLADDNTEAMMEAVNEAKQTSPDLHFCRLRPPMDISLMETRTTKLKAMEETGRAYVHELKEADELLSKLKSTRAIPVEV